MMKKGWAWWLFLLLPLSVLAQEETLISGGFESGGFGGPAWKMTLLDGDFGILTGGRGGWIINHTFVIGGGGYNTLWDIKTGRQTADGVPLYLEMGYGGLEITYIHTSDRLIHYTVNTLLGAGHARLEEHNPQIEYASDRFYVIEPGVNMEINVYRWVRICVGATYRFITGFETEDLSSTDLSGPSGVITLKFGVF